MRVDLLMLKKLLLSVAVLPILAHAVNFHVEDKYISTGNDFAKLCGNECPALNYGLISTNHAWVQHIINKSVVSVFGTAGDENSAQDLLYKEFAKIAYPSDRDLTRFLTASEKNLIGEHKKLVQSQGKTGVPWIDISSRPSYLGHRGNLELFAITEFYQFGNTAGTGSINYFVFDMDEKQQLSLDDVLLPNGQERLAKLVQEKFYTALQKGKVNLKNHEKSWPFFLTKNFTFNKDGIKFLYQPEEITPYNMGMPEFVIGYDQLKGIVLDKYL